MNSLYDVCYNFRCVCAVEGLGSVLRTPRGVCLLPVERMSISLLLSISVVLPSSSMVDIEDD
jgi:hypothetical protein